MDALAGYGSDSSSSIGSMPKADAVVVVGDSTNVNVAAAAPDSPPSKRRRRWDNNGLSTSTVNLKGDGLPPPHISNQQQSMILWDVDYLSSLASQDGAAMEMDESKREYLQERLKSLAERKDETGQGYSTQLKKSHDFHNPRFLENAASQIGITSGNMLGSNLPEQEQFETYEYRILELEEAARVKMYQQIERDHAQSQSIAQQQQESHDPSQLFAQDQLAQALQNQCQR